MAHLQIYEGLPTPLSPSLFYTATLRQHLKPPLPLPGTKHLRFSSDFIFFFHIYFRDWYYPFMYIYIFRPSRQKNHRKQPASMLPRTCSKQNMGRRWNGRLDRLKQVTTRPNASISSFHTTTTASKWRLIPRIEARPLKLSPSTLWQRILPSKFVSEA